jgi:hypothetical protein
MPKYRPNYCCFMKHQVISRNTPCFRENNMKYIENKMTKSISVVIEISFILLVCFSDTVSFIAKFSILIRIVFFILLALLLETMHWLYAKFELIEEQKDEE